MLIAIPLGWLSSSTSPRAGSWHGTTPGAPCQHSLVAPQLLSAKIPLTAYLWHPATTLVAAGAATHCLPGAPWWLPSSTSPVACGRMYPPS